MNGANHMATSLAISYLASNLLGYPQDLTFQMAYYSGAVIGSLLPDIDHPGSYLGRRTWGIFVPDSWKQKIASKTHRKLTHYLEIILPLTLLVKIVIIPISPGLGIGLLLGYISHLLADMMTPSGIPSILFNTKKLRFPWTFKSNSREEYLVTLLVVFACLAFAWL